MLPKNFDGLTHFGPWIRQLARSIEGGREDGNTWNVLYHRIGTGDSGSYKVINAGNTEAIRREVLPFEWRVSNANKLLMNVVDMTTLNAKVLKALNEGRLEAFGNELGQFHSDFQKYLANHRANLPGENGIGIERRNIINGLLSPGTKLNRGANPLTGDFGPRGIIRTIRMDRLEDASPALGPDGQPKTGFHFDYDKVNANRMPDVKPYPGMGDSEASKPQFMPDSTIPPDLQKEASDWQQQVEGYLRNPGSREMLKVGSVPPVLSAVGVSNAPLVMPPSVIPKVSGVKHDVPREVLNQLPTALRDPIFVFQSAKVSNAVTVLTALKSQGRNVLVAIHLDRPSPNKPANVITSLYDKSPMAVQGWIRDGMTLYANQQKARALFLSARLQLPREGTKAGNKNLLTEADIVKS